MQIQATYEALIWELRLCFIFAITNYLFGFVRDQCRLIRRVEKGHSSVQELILFNAIFHIST